MLLIAQMFQHYCIFIGFKMLISIAELETQWSMGDGTECLGIDMSIKWKHGYTISLTYASLTLNL